MAYDFLKLFYLEEVATGYSVAQRVACLRYFLRFFQSSRTAREDRVQAPLQPASHSQVAIPKEEGVKRTAREDRCRRCS